MSSKLLIRDEVIGGAAPQEWVLDLLSERITVRELIRSRVYQEVQDYNLRQHAEFRGLIQPADAERSLNGWRLKTPRQLDWKQHYERAIEAFDSNQIVILVNDRQVETLEEELTIDPDSCVTFLRLTLLVGG